MIVPVMAISNLVLTQQIYSEETNGAHAHYREPVPLKLTRRTNSEGQRSFLQKSYRQTGIVVFNNPKEVPFIIRSYHSGVFSIYYSSGP